jgi:hypothetical protein
MPFTKEQFLDVFVKYNTSVFPDQILLFLFAIAAIYFCFKKTLFSGRLISLILTILWLWMGVVYHLIFFSSINKAAYVFGTLYIVQSGLFFYTGVIKNKLNFIYRRDWFVFAGLIFIIYGLIIYPVLGFFLGHVYPQSPTFGLPCPTTIFTFGLLLWSDKKLPIYLLFVPFIWSLLGFFATLNFGVYEDIGLLVTGLIASLLIIIKNKKAEVTAGK